MIDADIIIECASGPIAEQSTRDKIQSLESVLSKLPQVDIPVVHRYSGGIYAREITIPAGVMLTGRIYKEDHFDVMVYGDVTVTTDEGRKRLTGFNISKGNTGKKRAGYTHAETRWITFCASDEMDDDDYLDHLTADSFDKIASHDNSILEEDIKRAFSDCGSLSGDDYRGFRRGFILASGKALKSSVDVEDYYSVLAEFGFTEKTARHQSEDVSDQIDLDDEYGVVVGKSEIEGAGLHAVTGFNSGEIIMPARIDGYRTVAGRYVNHSANPNAKMVMDGGDIILVAIVDIGAEEITTDYRESLSLQIEKVA